MQPYYSTFATTKSYIRLAGFMAFLLSSVFLAGLAHAELNVPYKISDSMVVFGDVRGHEISPDGSRVVYRADQDVDEVIELYSVSIEGGAVVKLNTTLAPGQNVYEYQISADGTRVVYLADQGSEGIFLYSVPIEGGSIAQLSGAFNGNVINFKVSADSSQVIYLVDENAGAVKLYSVPTAGGVKVKLNGVLVTGGNVEGDYYISANSDRVLYRADQDTDGVVELYSVPVAGGASVKINGALVAGGNVLSALVSADSTRVVYMADQETDATDEIYTVSIMGGVPIKLNSTLIVGGDVKGYRISPNSSRAIYWANGAGGTTELFTVPIAGGLPIKTNSPSGGFGIFDVKFSANSQWVVYAGREAPPSYGDDIFAVPLAGGIPVNLSSVDGGFVISYGISANSSRVVYRHANPSAFYSVAIEGGAPIELNDTPVAGGSMRVFKVSANSRWVVYLGDQDTEDMNELYLVPLKGGAITKLNGTLPFGAGVVNSGYTISPTSTHVVYSADQQVTGEHELFAVQIQKLENELCVPIKTSNGKMATICL